MRVKFPRLSRLLGIPSPADVDLLRSSDLMDSAWYRSYYYDLRDLHEEPALHYLKRGAREGRDPGPDFNTSFYLSLYPDVASAGVNALVHYLKAGQSEGRRPSPDFVLATPVENAPIACLRPVQLRPRMALVVVYAIKGEILHYMEHYLLKLASNDISPILVVASKEPFSGVSDVLADRLGGLYVREDDRQDFCAWAHVLRIAPELLGLETLVLLNDRFLGPVDDRAFGNLLERILASEADVIGLTDGYSGEWHIEPYFMALRPNLLQSEAFSTYLGEIVSYDDAALSFKNHIIPFMQMISQNHFSTEVFFPVEPGKVVNRTWVEWRELLSQGFPFVNISVVSEAQRNPQFNDLEMVVNAHGFDVPSLRGIFMAEKVANAVPVKTRKPPVLKPKLAVRETLDYTFSPEFYAYLYPDIARVGMDPLYHFRAHGRAEGRIGSLPGAARLAELSNTKTGRDTVLIVSHDGTRTGCPILSLNIANALSAEYNVVALFLGPGPMLESFKDEGITVIGPTPLGSDIQTIDNLMKYIHHAAVLKFAIINSIESRAVLASLARLYVPTVSLIHEFSAYTRSATAFRDAVRWAGETVFSAPLTRDDAIRSWPVLAARAYPVIPQGRCLPPKVKARPGSIKAAEAEAARVRRILRPEDFPPNGLVVIGIGTVQLRKGVDLFIECAAKVLASEQPVACRFVWVGRGYHPEQDLEYSAYLADQIKRAGLEQDVAFLGETTEVREVYALSNVLLLTSRLDPLPNVAIEAMEEGLPVLCFDRTTGIADVLDAEGLKHKLVAGYLDVEDLAAKLTALIRSPECLEHLSARSREIVDATFDMASYVSRLDNLAGLVAKRSEQERADVDTITAHRDLIRFDYYVAPGQTEKRLDRIVREYVRSWASEVDMRKLAPGFHPGVYLDRHGVEDGGDPLADFIRLGRPEGPWSYPVITSREGRRRLPRETRVGLHVHAHYPELFPELLERLKRNKVRPDLLISINKAEHEAQVRALLRNYPQDVVIRATPNRGRDIGPFLTAFGAELSSDYDIIGHMHTKKTADICDADIGRTWYRFLLENLLGGRRPMADVILGRMAEQPDLGLVFADDPHIVGWDANRRFVEPYLARLSIDRLPKYMHVPVGTMFWARPKALEGLFGLGLGWEDYPREPLPYDGSLLHGLERLFGIVAENAGFGIAGVNCPGVTR